MTRVFWNTEIQHVIFSILKQNILTLSKYLPRIIFSQKHLWNLTLTVTTVSVLTLISKAYICWSLNCNASLVHDISNNVVRTERKNIIFKGKMRNNMSEAEQSRGMEMYIYGYPWGWSVLQHLTAGWRACRCYQQPLQDVSTPADPGTALCLAWIVQMEVQSVTFSASWLYRGVAQLTVCSFATLLCEECLGFVRLTYT